MTDRLDFGVTMWTTLTSDIHGFLKVTPHLPDKHCTVSVIVIVLDMNYKTMSEEVSSFITSNITVIVKSGKYPTRWLI